MDEPDRTLYRQLIDRLVTECRDGQGQGGARRVLSGKWNANASSGCLPEQHQVNLMLERMIGQDRKMVAQLLTDEFVSGVHQTLVTLHEAGIPPFEEGYEGTPFHDFVGRLADWDWPEQ